MREIKFRGKRIDNGEWVYGSLLQSEIGTSGYVKCEIHKRFADDPSIARHEVIPESVGQWTGLKDKYGKEIYEGDIVQRFTGYRFEQKIRAYLLGSINHAMAYGFDFYRDDEVIGNIYESPELLNK